MNLWEFSIPDTPRRWLWWASPIADRPIPSLPPWARHTLGRLRRLLASPPLGLGCALRLGLHPRLCSGSGASTPGNGPPCTPWHPSPLRTGVLPLRPPGAAESVVPPGSSGEYLREYHPSSGLLLPSVRCGLTTPRLRPLAWLRPLLLTDAAIHRVIPSPLAWSSCSRGTSGLSAAPRALSGVGHLSAPSPVHPPSSSPIGAVPSILVLHRASPSFPIGAALHRSPPPVAPLTESPPHSPGDAAPSSLPSTSCRRWRRCLPGYPTRGVSPMYGSRMGPPCSGVQYARPLLSTELRHTLLPPSSSVTTRHHRRPSPSSTVTLSPPSRTSRLPLGGVAVRGPWVPRR